MDFASGALLKSAGVARFTEASVACADSMTAHKSWKGLLKLSSLLGLGNFCASTLKRSVRSSKLRSEKPWDVFSGEDVFKGLVAIFSHFRTGAAGL